VRGTGKGKVETGRGELEAGGKKCVGEKERAREREKEK